MKIVYADTEVTELLDLLLEYWKLTRGCDCRDLMTNKEENLYLGLKHQIADALGEFSGDFKII